MMKSILTTIAFIALAVSGLAQTRSVIVNTSGVVQSPTNFWSADASNARSGLGLGLSALTNTSVTNFRTAIGLGATNDVQFESVTYGGNQINFANAELFGPWAFDEAIGFFGNQQVAAETRTNLGLGATNTVFFNTVSVKESGTPSATSLNGIQWQSMYPSSNGLIGLYGSDAQGTTTFGINIGTMSGATTEVALFNVNRITFYEPLEFNNTTNAATTRTNLRLGWSALTNTSASGFGAALYGSGTNPVLYNTNGEVVSPTNFWQVAPITTTFIESEPLTNSSTNISGGRFLHIHSLAPAIGGVTNTIVLPTNGTTFVGDVALIVHQGPTNSLTRVRTSGSTNDLVTMSRFDETVEFVYYNDQWQFNHNQSFIEPIYFSGTNAAANIAASRTNLGLGIEDKATFGELDIRIGTNSADIHMAVDSTEIGLGVPLAFGFTNQTINAAITRTNLGIPLAALTNTNNVNFQAAIFNTNSAPTNSANVNAINFNTAIHWMEVNVVTNGVTNNFRIPLFK